MLSDAQQFITSNPLQALVPGILIILSVVSLNIVSIEITELIEARYKISEEVTKKRFSPADFILSYLKHGFVPEKNIEVSERKKFHGTVTAGNR